jgi:hypothetical protein
MRITGRDIASSASSKMNNESNTDSMFDEIMEEYGANVAYLLLVKSSYPDLAYEQRLITIKSRTTLDPVLQLMRDGWFPMGIMPMTGRVSSDHVATF